MAHQYNVGPPQQPAAAYTSPSAMNPNEKPMTNNTAMASHRHSSKWTFGLCDCCSPFGTCCLAYWCPCYLFGKTYERNQTGQRDPSGCGGMCCAWTVLSYFGCCGILQCVERGKTRQKYGIQGNAFGDFCIGCCCTCCTLVQEEKESIVRVEGVDPKTGQAYQYQPVNSMNYA